MNEIIDEISKFLELQKSSKSTNSFWKDLLTDATGYSLYRVQNAVFTLLLGATFIVQIWENVAMPDFDPSSLIVIGISSGT
jgi:hypothetical protein